MSDVAGWHSERDEDAALAKDIFSTLVAHYPGHPWYVEVKSGVMACYHQGYSTRYCMVRHLHNIQHDAGRRRQEVIRAAGEYLERAGVRRGAYDGDIPETIEGVPNKARTPRLYLVGK